MTTKAYLLTAVTLAVPLLLAQGQTAQTTAATPAAAPALSPTEQTIKDIKNPVPWFSWGADLRVREEYFNDILTLSPNDKANLNQQDYFRFRGRVWASVMPVEDVSLNVRLVDEVREWLMPAGYTPYKGSSGLDWREGVFDNLNAQWKNILQQPMALTVGRQDYLPGTPSGLGDGWLVGDGTPIDGSWTYYLDSARLSYDFKEQHTKIDVIGIYQTAKDDAWLPTINNQNYYNSEQDEMGAILWVANKSVPAVNVDGYFIFKHDYDPLPRPAVPTPGDEADIYTLGGRLSGLVADGHVKYSLEGAYQFGQKKDPAINNAFLAPSAQTSDYRNIDAFGAVSKVSYLFNDKLNNQASFSFEFLSGDNPSSKNDEMFDNLWGRYPRWSEIALYSYAAETRIGQEAGLYRFGPGWSLSPMKDMDFSLAYFALFSPEEIATRAAAASLFAGNANMADHGNFRGHFLQAVLKYKFSKHVVGHLWSEFEFPGNYYAYRTTMYFLRPEISFSF